MSGKKLPTDNTERTEKLSFQYLCWFKSEGREAKSDGQRGEGGIIDAQ